MRWYALKLFEETVESKTLFRGRIVTLRQDTARLENGALAGREVVEHPGGVCVLALEDDGSVYTVRQWRYPFALVTEELPAGKLEPGEDHRLAALRELAPGCVIWKTFQVRSAADLRAVHASAADLVLLDNGCGTGETFDWSLAGGVTRPFLLAGGLTPENIPAAVAALHPYGLDLSSGVETEKKKDRHKIEAAVAAARKE